MTREDVEKMALLLSDLNALDNTEFSLSIYRSAIMSKERHCSEAALEDVRHRMNIALGVSVTALRKTIIDDLRTLGVEIE